jgi:hypothetical protein
MPPDAPSINEEHIAYIVLSAAYQNQILSLGELLDAGYQPSMTYRRRVGGPDSIGLLLVLGEEEQILAFVSDIGEITADSPIYRVAVITRIRSAA